MSRQRLTAEQKRELVLEYLTLPHGQRGRWLAEHDVRVRTFHLWRQQLIVGALETGSIPR